jgi:Uma2 family endonuclease
MATATNGTETLVEPITVEQWAAIEGPPNYELIDGYLKEKPVVAVWHDILLFDLLGFLKSYIDADALGKLVGATTPLKISAYRGRKPDIFFIPKSLYRFVGKNLFKGIPPLVIEILSPSTEREDRIEKRREYARLGIGEYWIVDFPNRRVEVYKLRKRGKGVRRYELIQTASGSDVFRPGLFPGLEIPLAKIWPTEFEDRTGD